MAKCTNPNCGARKSFYSLECKTSEQINKTLPAFLLEHVRMKNIWVLVCPVVCMFTCMCAYVYLCVCPYLHIGSRLYCSPPYSFRQGLSLPLKLGSKVGAGDFPGSACLSPPVLAMPVFLNRLWGFKLHSSCLQCRCSSSVSHCPSPGSSLSD